MDEPSEVLMRKIAGGDARAFRTLTTRMGGKLFGLAYRLMNNDASAAEDAVQDTLIKLWTSAPNWKPTGKVEAYVMTILHHTCMDLHRKTRKTVVIPDDLVSPDQNATDHLIKQDQHKQLLTGIDTLPERQRTAVLLSYFGEESNRRIADILKISEGAVESLLVRARKTLARELPQDLRQIAQKGEE